MHEVGSEQPLRLAERVGARTARWVLAAVVVAAAAVLVGLRVPDTYQGFRAGAIADADRGALGGALAGADGVDVDNDFVAAAIANIPVSAQYAVLLPPSEAVAQRTYGINPLTLLALPGFMREILLPRLPVADPGRGDYVLCYDCDTSPWDHRTRWVWTSPKGYAIGRVYK